MTTEIKIKISKKNLLELAKHVFPKRKISVKNLPVLPEKTFIDLDKILKQDREQYFKLVKKIYSFIKI